MVLTIAMETARRLGIFPADPEGRGNFLHDRSPRIRALGEEALRRNVTMRLEHCSKALENVSSCVNAVSDRLGKLYEPNAQWVYDRAAEKTCQSCGLRAYCWEKERDMTLDDFHRLTRGTQGERGSVKEERYRGEFREAVLQDRRAGAQHQ